jgi:hypothetical protein
MSGEQTRETPLAWSQAGDAFDVPDAAVLWRVRRLSGNIKGGAPELVYGPDGLPLMVDITIGPADFMEAVEAKPGKYRLDALDELRKPVAAVPPAYFVISSANAPRSERHESATSDVALRTLADALRQQSDKLGEVFKQQADQINGLISQVRDFAQCLAAGRSELPPAPGGAAPAPRNGTAESDNQDDEQSDDQDDDQNDDQSDDEDAEADEGAAKQAPDWFDRVQGFCTHVPAANLHEVGSLIVEHGGKLVGDAVRNLVTEGIGIPGLLGKNGDGSTGGGS